ncbi:MAG: ATP-binding cassette domain-containing protein [Acetobacteraceae bacterium]|nr:ATP-binding cassette domain-containing protein [Acetobacteraceae bacterium]
MEAPRPPDPGELHPALPYSLVVFIHQGGGAALHARAGRGIEAGRDNLRYFAELYGVPPARIRPRVEELLALLGLEARALDRVENYSRGMKQRLHIARGLVHDPELVFMDEPTLGLDPEGAVEVRALIRRLKEANKTVFLTTHYRRWSWCWASSRSPIRPWRPAPWGSPCCSPGRPAG